MPVGCAELQYGTSPDEDLKPVNLEQTTEEQSAPGQHYYQSE